MSATLNANLFVDYFQRSLRDWGYGSFALITIPGRAFPVETYFLEDALEHTVCFLSLSQLIIVGTRDSR
jgi:HrpA-like RNA helicase